MSRKFEQDVLTRITEDRRDLVKKLAKGAKFAAPVVASFSMLSHSMSSINFTSNSTN
jgi:hypothetical protein